MATEEEEFEFRARAEAETAGRKRTPREMTAMETAGAKALNLVGALTTGGPIGRAGRQGLAEVDKAKYELGGLATDYASKAGLPPKGAAMIGGATNIGLDALTMVPFARAGQALLGVPLSKMATHEAEHLMGSALKPTPTQWASGEGAQAVQTMLDKGLTVRQGSVLKLRTELDGLQKQVSDALAKSNATVPKQDVVNTINEAAKHFKGGTSEVQDLKVIKDVVREFEKAPSVKNLKDIPVQVAQRMKQLEYRKLDKAYGAMGDAEETARKGTARGLKEGINKAVPEVAALNAEEKKIYQTLPVLERRAMMEINRNPAGLAALAHHPGVAAAMMFDRSSLFKSWLANKLNTFANKMIPTTNQTTADLLGEGAGVSLYQIGKSVDERPANR